MSATASMLGVLGSVRYREGIMGLLSEGRITS
jgi:hypothetical protein